MFQQRFKVIVAASVKHVLEKEYYCHEFILYEIY